MRERELIWTQRGSVQDISVFGVRLLDETVLCGTEVRCRAESTEKSVTKECCSFEVEGQNGRANVF